MALGREDRLPLVLLVKLPVRSVRVVGERRGEDKVLQAVVEVEAGHAPPSLEALEVRLDVGYLNVGLLGGELVRVHRVRVLDYDDLVLAKTFRVERFQAVRYLGELGQRRFLVDELFAVQVAEDRPVKAHAEVGAEDPLALELVNLLVGLAQLAVDVGELLVVVAGLDDGQEDLVDAVDGLVHPGAVERVGRLLDQAAKAGFGEVLARARSAAEAAPARTGPTCDT